MCRADHPGVAIREQHRRAIRGEDAEQQPRPIGDERIGARAQPILERFDHRHRIARMDLIDSRQLRAGQDRVARAPAILGDGGGIVLRSGADVQPRNDARGDAPAPPQKAVGDSAQRAGAMNLHRAHSAHAHSRSSSI